VTLPKVATEMALCVLGYNLTRVLNIVGMKPLLAAVMARYGRWRAPLRFMGRVKEPRHGVRMSSGRVAVNFAQIDRIAVA
jgi:hypothetical protein